ncbi:hypothetical protein NDU88_002377 [Pleurodeles waltl]|uniref:Uncharacterized protein n=1 Tax=Pleurodeles waltl TaxID=8319 RepID=A0AAV7QBI8_PLEWA|nr:hypothetical protein NDU88_002377 [Pleurodeles waltl]
MPQERRNRLGVPDRRPTWGSHGATGHPGAPPATERGHWASAAEQPRAQKNFWRMGECPARGDSQTPVAAYACFRLAGRAW